MQPFDRIMYQLGHYQLNIGIPNLPPDVSRWTVNKIVATMSDTATQTPNRAFLWNTMAENNFMNNFFQTMLSDVGNYIQFLARNNPNHNIESIVNKAANEMIECWLAIGVSQNPQLQQLNGNNINHINQMLTMYQNLKNNFGMVNGMGGMGGNTLINPNIQPNVGVVSTGSISGIQNSGMSSMSISDGSQPKPISDNNPFGSFGVINSQNNQQTQAPVNQPVNDTPIQRGEGLRTLLDSFGWMPTVDQTHKPAYRKSTEKITVNNGIAEVVKMNREEHHIPTAIESLYAGTFDPVSTEEFIKTASSDGAEIPIADDIAQVTLAEDSGKYIMELSEVSIQVDMMVKAAGIRWEKGTGVDVYHREASLLTTIISNTPDELKAVKSFLEQAVLCQTFNQIIDLMRSPAARLPYQITEIFDKRLTNAINTVISKVFSIANLTISSFYADIHDLMAILDKDYGVAVTQPLIRNQADIISKCFKQVAPEIADSLTSDWYPQTANGKSFVLYLEDPSIYTLVNFNSIELDVGFDESVSAVLTMEHTPALLKLAEYAFKKYNLDTIRVFCLDGIFYTIRKAWLTNSYLIYK